MTHGAPEASLRCSFCRQPGKLISSPGDYPRAYICEQCVAVCASILSDDKEDTEVAPTVAAGPPHPLLDHPLASELMQSVLDWIREESLGGDAAEPLCRLREVAAKMIQVDRARR